ncbi:MAG: hypothetical protein R3B06_21105 [Kofleriaceae bacterium]
MSQRVASVVLVLASLTSACASGQGGVGDDDVVDARVPQPDAAPPDAALIDAPVPDAALIDAATPDAAPIDAATPDAAMTDAPPATDAPPTDAPPATDAPPIDGAGCTPGTTQLLVNANLDGTPIGTGWAQTPIDAMYPLITADALAALPPHSAPNHLWLGGIVSGSDSAEQTVTIPPGTTQLVLHGMYAVLTGESGTTVYDSAATELVSSAGVVLETAQALSNTTVATTYTPFTFTFASPHAGQTVRLRVRSTNDISLETSFFWDTLALDAVVTCP